MMLQSPEDSEDNLKKALAVFKAKVENKVENSDKLCVWLGSV